MCLYDGLGKTEKRRAAVFRRIEALFHVFESALDTEVGDLGHGVCRKYVGELAYDEFRKPLAELEDDISREAVADENVALAVRDILTLNIADEI